MLLSKPWAMAGLRVGLVRFSFSSSSDSVMIGSFSISGIFWLIRLISWSLVVFSLCVGLIIEIKSGVRNEMTDCFANRFVFSTRD